ncbi:hypothetical protein AB6A40_008556 [Gnathostoma spinigerum]|uniref:Target of rapamycin complex subunit lst8 n=1 Tax=Gnathostoma spinigerum TaxID=75299 RepID=A0ABD6EZ14_9BILA
MTVSSALLASSSYDQSIRVWNVGSGDCVESFAHKESQVNVMQFAPDRCHLAVGGWQLMRLYDIQSAPPSAVSNCDALQKNIMCIGFEDRGQWMYTGGEDCTAKVWDYRCSLQCQRIFQVSQAVNSVALHPNQVVLFVADSSGALYVWDLRRDSSETFASFNLEISEYFTHIDINRTGELLTAVTNRGHILLWSLGTMDTASNSNGIIPIKMKTKQNGHEKYALKCHFSPDGQTFVTCGADGRIIFWDSKDLSHPSFSLSVDESLPPTIPIQQSTKAASEAKWVWDCAFTNDANYLIAASGSKLRLWDIERKEVIRYYQGHNKTITSMAFMDAR